MKQKAAEREREEEEEGGLRTDCCIVCHWLIKSTWRSVYGHISGKLPLQLRQSQGGADCLTATVTKKEAVYLVVAFGVDNL